MAPDVGARLGGPKLRYLRTLQIPPGGRLCHVNRILEHCGLCGMQARKVWIPRRVWVVSEPEIDPTVGGQEHRVARDKVIVNPAR